MGGGGRVSEGRARVEPLEVVTTGLEVAGTLAGVAAVAWQALVVAGGPAACGAGCVAAWVASWLLSGGPARVRAAVASWRAARAARRADEKARRAGDLDARRERLLEQQIGAAA